MSNLAEKLYKAIREEIDRDNFCLINKKVKLVESGKVGTIVRVFDNGVEVKTEDGSLVKVSEGQWNEIREEVKKEGKMNFEKVLEMVKANVDEGRVPNPNAQEKDKIKDLIEQTTKIKTEHPGILEVPEGKHFYQLPLKHYIDLAKKKGKPAIMRALLNLERWNKNRDPETSKKARELIDKLKKNKEWQALSESVNGEEGKKEAAGGEGGAEGETGATGGEGTANAGEGGNGGEAKADSEVKEMVERLFIARLLSEKKELNEKEKKFLDETLAIELTEEMRKKVLEAYRKLFGGGVSNGDL